MDNIKIAYIGGGSRGWARGLMCDLALQDKFLADVFLYDIDYNASKDNEYIGNSLKNNCNAKSKINYFAVKSLKEALIDANFVIISVLPGTFDEMEVDVHYPEKYGILQSVGDTVGPGGCIRALRTIPIFINIAKEIEKYCPKAWVINYTNPMSICVKTLYSVFPKIKAFGCCHEVFGTQWLLAHMCNEFKIDNKKIVKDDITVNVLGINHFTFIDKAFYKDIDLFPLYQQFVNLHYIKGYNDIDESNWLNNSFDSCNRVKFDLFKKFGLIACAGDRHLAEFCNSNWYLKDKQNIYYWKFSTTPVEWRKKDLKERLNKTERLLKGKEVLDLKPSGEEGIRQICALLGFNDLTTNVNLPNTCQIENLPKNSVVETNAVFSKDKIIPVQAGKLPSRINNMIYRNINNQELIVESCLTKNYKLAYLAFINDPLVNISLDDSKRLFIDMIENTSKFHNINIEKLKKIIE